MEEMFERGLSNDCLMAESASMTSVGKLDNLGYLADVTMVDDSYLSEKASNLSLLGSISTSGTESGSFQFSKPCVTEQMGQAERSDDLHVSPAWEASNSNPLLRELDAPWNVSQSLEGLNPVCLEQLQLLDCNMETVCEPVMHQEFLPSLPEDVFDSNCEVPAAQIEVVIEDTASLGGTSGSSARLAGSEKSFEGSDSSVDGQQHSSSARQREKQKRHHPKDVPIDPYHPSRMSKSSEEKERSHSSFHNLVRYIKRRSGHHGKEHGEAESAARPASVAASSPSNVSGSPVLGKLLAAALEFRGQRSHSLEGLSGFNRHHGDSVTRPEQSCEAVYTIYDKILKEGKEAYRISGRDILAAFLNLPPSTAMPPFTN